ncbi:MAG: NUDIX domain-containing protein [Actinomycetota bacterium]
MKVNAALDGERFATQSNGGDWIISWHASIDPPTGTPHGASAICLTGDMGLVLISPDGKRWGLPGGRPEGSESGEETMRREVMEEACATVHTARLTGFMRGECISGPEEGLVLIRSQWVADVDLQQWAPQYEIPHRRVVPASQWREHIWIEDGWLAFVTRAFSEANIA